MQSGRNENRSVIFLRLSAVALVVVCCSGGTSVLRRPAGHAQLVSIQQLSPAGDVCQWDTAADSGPMAGLPGRSIFDWLDQTSAYAAVQNGGQTTDLTAPPVRKIRDTYPIYSSVAVDLLHDEVVLQDNNLWSTKIFNRLDDTPAEVEFQQPKRVIEGANTHIQYNNGLYVDQETGDIYSIESDTGDRVVVFAHGAKGDVPPARQFVTPHRGYAIAVDEEKDELYATVEYPPQVAVYKKQASGESEPLRVIKGDDTGLRAAHGIAIDVKRNLMFVGNWGNESNFRVAGTGKFHPPSISVYPLGANGNVAPIRVIQGDETRLNWPAGLSLDPETGDLYVANDVDHSILVFKSADQGDVAPSRVIKGAKTGMRNPTGIFIDTKHREVWVANLGNSTATVYPMDASGDVAPLRTIRSRPLGTVSLNFGKTEAVTYDSRREQLLVPN